MSDVLRLATPADLVALLRWRNDPVTRQFRNDPRIVTEEEHGPWLLRRQASDGNVYIFERDCVPVGNLTLDVENGAIEFGWIVAPEYRSMGNGKRMVRAGLAMFFASPMIWAKARVDNVASIALAQACGFVPFTRVAGMVFMRARLQLSGLEQSAAA